MPTHIILLIEQSTNMVILTTVSFSKEEADKIVKGYGECINYRFEIHEVDYSIRD